MLVSIQQSIARAEAAEPGTRVGFVAFPGTPYASPHHYGVFMRGDEALTSRLYKPVLIDAQTGQITNRRTLPWYLTALLISQPLHFGDYGGGWMQFLWALLADPGHAGGSRCVVQLAPAAAPPGGVSCA
jgi:uncharacterized iron-regulated membrane protein